MKKPLQVGERVRVYGWVQMHHQPYQARGGGKATVTYVGEKPHVKFDHACAGPSVQDENHYAVDPKQVRRIVKPKRRSVWIASSELEVAIRSTSKFAPAWGEKWGDPRLDLIEFREVRKAGGGE